MIPAQSIKIGSVRVDLIESPGAHSASAQAMGPEGPVSMYQSDFSGGMLDLFDGMYIRPGQPTDKFLSAKGADTRVAHQVILQPEATTVTAVPSVSVPFKQFDHVPSGGSVVSFLLTSGRYVHRFPNGGSAFEATPALDFGAAGVIGDGVSQAGYAVVGAVGTYAYSNVGTSWAAVATAADRLGVLNDNLWRAQRPNLMYSAASPTGTWTSSYNAADAGYNINSLTGLEQLLIIGKEDGVFGIDAYGATTPFTPELRFQPDSNVAPQRGAVAFNGDYYFTTKNSIIRMSGDGLAKEIIGLDYLVSPDLPGVQVRALTTDGRYLYALVNNDAAGLMILARNIEGRWHVFYWDPAAGRGRHLAVSAAPGFPALFFSYTGLPDTGPTTIKYIRLPTFGNPRDDTNYRFDTAAGLWVRVGRFGDGVTKMAFDECVLVGDNLSATRTLTPYYSVDGGAVTQFGSTSATAVGRNSIKPASPIEGVFFDFYVYLATNSSSQSPVLREVEFRGVRRTDQRVLHTFLINADTYHKNRREGRVKQSPVKCYTDLVALVSSSVQSITDQNQQTFSGYVLSVDWAGSDDKLPNREPPRTIKVVVAEKA